MQSDLCFFSVAAERQFRRQADGSGARVAAEAAAARTLLWISLALRLWALGAKSSAMVACLAVLTSAAYLVATWLTCRMFYTATVVLNTSEVALLCHVTAALWIKPEGEAASMLHALVRLGGGNGCLWLAVCSWRYPLPFRLSFPQLSAMTVVFIHYTPTFCSKDGLYATCGFQQESCAVGHAACLLTALTLIGQRLYRRELVQRIAWQAGWCGRPPAGMQLVTDGVSYWLNFALPAVCCISTYSAALRAMPPAPSSGQPASA